MTFQDFDKYCDDLIKEVKDMRDTKGREYAGDKDRFDNFNRLSQRLNLSRETVWAVYFTKHMDAIESYIRGGRVLSDESIQGRIVDAITYLTLLGGMIYEKEESKKQMEFGLMQAVQVAQGPIQMAPNLYDSRRY